MPKDYIEKVIDEKVQFESDYSKIKEQVNIKPKQANKKRWVWPNLSIGLVFIAVIIMIIVSLSLRNSMNLVPDQGGVHYDGNSESGNGVPSMPYITPFVYYVDIEKKSYSYDEEFIIRYRLRKADKECISEGDLNIKIISEYFEFLSPTEYTFKDIHSDTYEWPKNELGQYIVSNDYTYPIDLEIKAKALKETPSFDSIVFTLEYNMPDEIKDKISSSETLTSEISPIKGEFTEDYKLIQRIYFINDELGVLFADYNRTIILLDPSTKEIGYYNVEPGLWYASLNRLYSKKVIDKKKYMRKLIHYYNPQGVLYSIESWTEGKYKRYKAEYISENIRVSFRLKETFEYLEEKKGSALAKELVKILYEQNKITLEEYNNEIMLIEEDKYSGKGIGRLYSYDYLIPFSNYEKYIFDFKIDA
ncbi:MAG: hypothetical protein K2M84_05500 [Anaeroplasmataceae bacterium]|nr:hypothetical protein [Anaeroplasmataceae bacterium]